jgi:hypothetical protein
VARPARAPEPPLTRGTPPSDVVVVGGGPAGMTAALLLARAGHRVTIFEREDELGGLWASRLDAEGHFRGDNSCKVYQSTYRSAPALFALIGTTWQQHFTARHDLSTDWLRPFVADTSWRDRAVLIAAYVQYRAGGGRFHEVSVEQFLSSRRISDRCQAWMRATALGGIAGTLRMTMWEFFHRIGTNIAGILRGVRDPLYWNAQPPNADGGFLGPWKAALHGLGVQVRTGVGATSLERSGDGVVVVGSDGGRTTAAAAFLALPPPALGALLGASERAIGGGFGLSGGRLDAYLEESRYEHLGISWFFDEPLAKDLPLGGHNVRQGWHPILVQHDQYRDDLGGPAVSVVVGSIALDTVFRHHRLGTLACEHSHEELAAIVWQDERERDPSLPEPIDVEVYGLSSATQIVPVGPLPLRGAADPVFLATSIHGETPYFTASLESAIQAGAIAAARFDPGCERLPMGDVRPSPWASAAPPPAPRPRVVTPSADPSCAGSS